MELIQEGSGEGSTNADAIVQDAAFSAVTTQHNVKIADFPLWSLTIGTWEVTSRCEGDFVAKFYYSKRKLVWEVMESGLKSKMEIQWSDISAMDASCPENHPGTLKIEVSRPPLFFRETNFMPKKHTLWQATSDFTGGQASSCKHHSLQFPEGVFGKHYEKLLQCDPRLKALAEGSVSMRPMPNHPNLMFDAKYPNHLLSLLGNGLVNEAREIWSDRKAMVKPIKMQPNNLISPSLVMDPPCKDDKAASNTEYLKLHDDHHGYDVNPSRMPVTGCFSSCNNFGQLLLPFCFLVDFFNLSHRSFVKTSKDPSLYVPMLEREEESHCKSGYSTNEIDTKLKTPMVRNG